MPWSAVERFERVQKSTGGTANLLVFGALEELQAVIADMQPAASAPMAAEKQPTWADDC